MSIVKVYRGCIPADLWQRRGFGLLERNAVKVARSVLREVGSGDRARLPDVE
jgi:hypothetical protein